MKSHIPQMTRQFKDPQIFQDEEQDDDDTTQSPSNEEEVAEEEEDLDEEEQPPINFQMSISISMSEFEKLFVVCTFQVCNFQ